MTKTLFIWAGGKTRMLKHYERFLPQKVDEYSEPFFGAGALYIYAQERWAPKKSYICDSNWGIISIYKAIRDDLRVFTGTLRAIENAYLPLNKEDRKRYYYRMRDFHAWHFPDGDETAAPVLYFLMRTCFNGIWQINQNTNNRFGASAGLLNQERLFDYEVIELWNKWLQNTDIIYGDYATCPTGDFTFYDPPYRNSFISYGVTFDDNSLKDLLEKGRNTKGEVLISNRDDNTGFIESISDGYDIHKFPITYTAGRRKKTLTGFEAKKATEILLIKK